MKINQRVLVMREAIEKIVPMLASRAIKVTQRGTGAFVEWDEVTLKPKRVNVPYLPDDASDELIDAVQGFIDHEVSHVLHTDVAAVAESHKHGKIVASLGNIVEDPLIEKRSCERFAGSAYNLSNTARFFLRERVDKNFARAMASGGSEKAVVNVLVVPAVRAWFGQPEYIEYMRNKWPLLDNFKRMLGEDLIAEIPRCASTWDCTDLAIRMGKRIEELLKPGKPDSEKGEGGSEQGEGEPGEPQDGDSEQSGEDRDDKGDDAGKGDKEDKEDKEDEEDEGDEGDEEGGASKGAGEGGEEDSKEGDEEGGGEPAQGEGKDESEGDAEQGKSEGGELTHGNPRPKMNQDLLRDLEAAVADAEGFDEALGEALSERARSEAKNSDYLVFTRDDDKIETLQVKGRVDVAQMMDEVDSMVGPMQKDIERMIAARSAAVWTGGHKRGRLDGANLFRAQMGRVDLFRRKQENRTKDVAVSLVIDCSGSMTIYRKLETACYAAYALSSVLDRLNIAHEVVGFSTRPYSADVERDMRNDPLAEEYARLEALYMPVFKAFDERMGSKVRERFAYAPTSRGLCRNNVDGECVQIAHRRLAARKEARKIMLVLSDGQPSAEGFGDFEDHLSTVVRSIEASGTDVVGIGIMDNSVRHFYKRNIVIRTVQDLPGAVMGQLKALLMK